VIGTGLPMTAASYSWQKSARASTDRKVEIPAMDYSLWRVDS
jgi:hypothetical protein